MTGNIQAVTEPSFRSLVRRIDILLWQRVWLCRGILMMSRDQALRSKARESLQTALRHRAMVQTLTPIGKRVWWVPCSPIMLLRGMQLGVQGDESHVSDILRSRKNVMQKRYQETIQTLQQDPSRHSQLATLRRLQSET